MTVIPDPSSQVVDCQGVCQADEYEANSLTK